MFCRRFRRLFLYMNLIRYGVQKAYSGEEDIKTPFDKIKCGLPTALHQKEVIQMSDTYSLSHTKWNCKYHISLCKNVLRTDKTVKW